MDTQLITILQTPGLKEEKKNEIASALTSFFDKAAEWKATVDSLVITDPKDTGKMSMARQGRLALKNMRLDAEKLITAKRQYVQSLMADFKLEDTLWLKALQMIQATFKSLESQLEEKEKFAERWESEQKAKLTEERRSIAEPYVEFIPAGISFGNLSESDFNKLIDGAKLQQQAKIEAEHKAEAERIEREAEQERIRVENARLKAEAEEREKVIAAEKAKAEAERIAQEKKLAEEKAKAEAARKTAEEKARKEREAAEAELRRKQEEIDRVKREAEEAAKKAREEADRKERERIAAEKAKAEAERIAHEKKLADDRAKAEAEIKRQQDEVARLNAEREERERQEKLKAEKEVRERKEAELKAEAERKQADERAAAAPDKQRIEDTLAKVSAVVSFAPKCKTTNAETIMNGLRKSLLDIVEYYEEKIENL